MPDKPIRGTPDKSDRPERMRMVVSKDPTKHGLPDEPHVDPIFGKFNRLLVVMDGEDERGLVLSASAYAEDCLGRILSAYLRKGEPSKGLIEGFNAPLGTLAARLKAGYAIGILSREQYRDLDLMRKIRNEFAHQWEGCSFDNGKIAGWIYAMSESRIGSPGKAKSPRQRFAGIMACIMAELEYLLSTLGAGKIEAPEAWTHLSAKPTA